MWRLLIVLFYLGYSTACFAVTGKEFLQELAQTEMAANTIQKRIGQIVSLGSRNLENENLKKQIFQYFGHCKLDNNFRKKIEEVQGLITHMGSPAIPLSATFSEDPFATTEAISSISFCSYLTKIPVLMKLRDKISTIVPKECTEITTTSSNLKEGKPEGEEDSQSRIFEGQFRWGFIKDMETIFSNFNSYQGYLNDVDQYLFSFLKTEDRNHAWDEYRVSLNFRKLFLQERQQIRNVYNILKRIDIEKFEINEDYKNQLRFKFEAMKTILEDYLKNFNLGRKANPKKFFVQNTDRELTKGPNYYEFENTYFLIDHFYQTVMDPLGGTFDKEDQSEVFLSEEEKIKNTPIFKKMFEEEIKEEVVKIKEEKCEKEKRPATQQGIKKEQTVRLNRKLKRQLREEEERQKQREEAKEQERKRMLEEEEKEEKEKNETQANEKGLEILSHQDGVLPSIPDTLCQQTALKTLEKWWKEGAEKEKGTEEEEEKLDVSPHQNESSSSVLGSFSEESSLSVPQKFLEDTSPFEACSHWLRNIMNETSSQTGEFCGIFQKAYSLLAQLQKNNFLLDNIQQTTSELALRLREIQKEKTQKTTTPLFCKVPKNYEADLVFFLETPVKYLKGIRFCFVRRLLEGLGGTVDPSHSGSRIHVSLNNKETSIHLHDSVNGELEGGRISSLRQFIIDAGFVPANK